MKKGISLIALIITIIVLIILVSVVVLNAEGPMEEAIYAKFANDVSVIQESVTMKLLDNEARYAINQKAELLKWIGIIDGYTEEMANEGMEPPFNNSIIVIKGNRVLKLSPEMKKNLNITEVEFDNYYVDAKGKVYHSGLQIGENIYYTAEDKYISSDTITSNSEENTIIVSQDVQTYIIQGYVPIYTAEQFLQIGSNIQNYEIRDLNDTVIKADGFNMNSNANYILANNIDFTGYEVEPIAEFSGIFDGNGYTISNIVIDNSNSASDFVPIEFAISTDLVKHPAAIFEKLSDGAIVKKIYVNDISVKGDRTVAVIGGECNGSVLVKDCHVTNVALEVYESSAIGGILAFAYNAGEEIIRVENCSIDNIEIVEQKNTDITYANAALEGNGLLNSAGIVSISKTNLEIVNCIVENSVTASKELAAGTVYFQQGKSIYVENCVVKDINLARSTSAGIIAIVKNTNIEITECRCENININANGIAGGMIAYCVNTNETFEITNCIVRNVDFVNGFDTGGIVGTLQSNTTSIINYCIVENCEIESTNLRGGIVAYCLSPITMSNNNVTNLNMINGGCATGGLVGILRYNTEVISTFTNCNVDYITISADEIVAGLVAQVEAPVTFTNCNAYNLNITSNYSNVGGIVGMLKYSSTVSSIFTDCDVSYSVCNSSFLTGLTGSIIGYASNKVELANCDIINNELNAGSNVGGLIGMLGNSSIIIECNVNNTEMNCTGGSVGGILGFAVLASENYLTIEECYVNNINYNTDSNFGGIIGNFDSSLTNNDISITYCEVDTVIKDDIDQSDNGAFGGIIGYWYGSANTANNDIIDNCTVSNINIAKNNIASAIVGHIHSSSIKISNCDISNFIIDNISDGAGGLVGEVKSSNLEILACDVTGLEIKASNNAGGIVGILYESGAYNLTIDQCILNDINIKASECLGGIVGYTKNNITTITNCVLTNLTLGVGAVNTGNIIAVSTAVTLVITDNTVN